MAKVPAPVDMRVGDSRMRAPAASGLFVAVVIIGFLYFAQEVLVPIALAILLSFVLAPLARLLQRYWIPRTIAIFATVLLAFTLFLGLAAFLAGQLTELANDLPRYQYTIQKKIRSFRGATEGSGGIVDRVTGVFDKLNDEFDRSNKPANQAASANEGSATTPAEPAPVPVVIREAAAGPFATLGLVIDPLLHPLATTFIIIVFVIFILLAREDLRNRLIRLAGAHDIQNTTAAMDDAGRRLSRLFLTQLAVNTGFAVVISIGLWVIGVPSPILWGSLAGIFRFVPYVGAIIGAIFPLSLAAAVDPGWSMMLWTGALFLAIEPIVGHVIEPMVYGRSTGLSPVAVIAAATFWTWLWGPIGLLLATPLTVVLVVLGRHVKALEFLDIMLGDQPALKPAELFYQRMLAGDPIEAVERATAYLKERSLTSYYDEVVLKGLELAQRDHVRQALSDKRVVQIRASLEELIDDLADQDDRAKNPSVTSDAETSAAIDETGDEDLATDLPVLTTDRLRPEYRSDIPVLIISGRGPFDDAAARVLSQLLLKHGLSSKIVGTEAITTANLFSLDPKGVAMICCSYVDPASLIPARTAVKRVRRRAPKADVMVCLWHSTDADDKVVDRDVAADLYANNFWEAVSRCLEKATRLPGHDDADPSKEAEDRERSVA